jgi:very-short-patch-repair endonuclease
MRFALTRSEAVLWSALRGKRLGVVFRRQVAVDRYIVDFFAPEFGLAVEVDGGWYLGRIAADAKRDARLARLGVRVLRVGAEEVLAELPVVLGRIRAALVSG